MVKRAYSRRGNHAIYIASVTPYNNTGFLCFWLYVRYMVLFALTHSITLSLKLSLTVTNVDNKMHFITCYFFLSFNKKHISCKQIYSAFIQYCFWYQKYGKCYYWYHYYSYCLLCISVQFPYWTMRSISHRIKGLRHKEPGIITAFRSVRKCPLEYIMIST